MDRLARVIAGRANGVVLGGGGARGFAAIGVLRALHESGVPVDRIGGTSMGSLIAAQYACGLDFKAIEEVSYEYWVKGKPARDFTLPILSLVRGKRMQQLVIDLCGEWRIEDMPLRYFCVSSDLGSAELVVHNRGRLWPAVRASGSFPVMGPPMFMNGRVLVDGGVLNNLPSDIMRSEFGGHIIAVDASPQRVRTVAMEWDEQTPSGWHLLWRQFNPFAERAMLPGILEVLSRTATLNSERMSRQAGLQADLLIAPPLGGYGTMRFEKMHEIIEIGYRHTLAELEALDKSGREPRFFRAKEKLGETAEEGPDKIHMLGSLVTPS
jgi:predicted acylesterase/phospholipase RssA